MRTAMRGDYHIAEWSDEPNYRMESLLERFPAIIERNFVCITSWDSGRYRPNESEFGKGWSADGSVTYTPQVLSVSELPIGGFDEWFVFEKPQADLKIEALTNYYQFSPIDFDFEEKLELFWGQINTYRPLNVVGDGTHLFFLTRDETLFQEVVRDSIGSVVRT